MSGKKVMKKTLKFVALLLVPLFFTSCIDYVQSVTYKDGQYQLYYKTTLSKILFEMSGDDTDDMADEIDGMFEDTLPYGVTGRFVDTEYDVGLEVSLAINEKTRNEEEKALLPSVSGDLVYIPFMIGNNAYEIGESMTSGSNDMAGGIALAIMASAKCRVMISKTIVPSVESAYFEGIYYSDDYEIPVYDLGDSYCLEISFGVFAEDEDYIMDRIVIRTK